MAYIANQRIKHGGKYYGTGDPIELTEDEANDLPKGAVSPDESGAQIDQPYDAAKLKTAVEKLPPQDFKNDGGIRAAALRSLVDQLGFEVTEEQVDAAISAIKS